MITVRLRLVLFCFGILLAPTCATFAAPPVEAVPFVDSERAFVVTPDSYKGYQSGNWHDKAWNYYTYAGLWTLGTLPTEGDPVAITRARIAKEVVGVEQLEVERGVFSRAAGKEQVTFRLDENAKHPRVVWEDGVVIVGSNPDVQEQLSPKIVKAIQVAALYDLHPGWMTGSFFRTIASPVEHPISVASVAKAMNCDWVVWTTGQNDTMTVAHAQQMMRAIETPDSDAMLMLGGLPLARRAWHGTKQGWSITVIDSKNDFDRQNCSKALKYYVDKAHDGGGLVFATPDTWRKAPDIQKTRRLKEPFAFDGIIGLDPELSQTEPFIERGGRGVPGDPKTVSGPSSTLLWIPRGSPLTRATWLEAIRARRAVHIKEGTQFVGPAEWVAATGLLMLSGQYLQEQCKTDIAVIAQETDWNQLTVTVSNHGDKPFVGGVMATTGTATQKPVRFPGLPEAITIPAGAKKVFTTKIEHGTDVSGKDLAIRVAVLDKEGAPYKEALTHLRFPRAVRGYQTLVVPPGASDIPFTIWNTSDEKNVTWQVRDPRGATEDLMQTKGELEIAPNRSGRVVLHTQINREGAYEFTLDALGQTATTRVLVRKQTGGKTKHWMEDMNKDGHDELFFENDHVKGVFLLQGGRLIRFWNKANGDNVFSEIWPEEPEGRDKATDHSFWPYGGLEEFISYPKIHGHAWFTHKVVRDDDQAFAVEMIADIHGQVIKKTFTLYAGSGLLELRYELDFTDPSVLIVGVNPILALGEAADGHDVSIIPTADGLVQHRYDPDRMHGSTYLSNEGWVAHMDEREQSSLIQTYPLNDTLMMHLWNNTPENSQTKYFYTELQPWYITDTHTTTYYSCYFLPHAGDWKVGLQKLKQIGVTP